MKQELIGLGFNEREAGIYLILMKHGKATAGIIAKELSLDRRVVYDSLDIMARKGRVTVSKIMDVLHYGAVPPEELKSSVKDSLLAFEGIVSQLNALRKKGKESEVRTWFGIKAIDRIVNMALQSKEQVLLMGRGGYLIQQLGESRHQYISKLNLLDWKMIQTEDYKKTKSEFRPREIRYLPKSFVLETAYMVFEDKLYLFTKKEEIEVIEILDKSFAETYKQYFKIFWKIAKP